MLLKTKRLFLFGLPILLLSIGIICEIWRGSNRQRVIISNAIVNYGIIKKGIYIKHTIHIVNYSLKSVVVITDSGCGCTILNVSKARIPPLGGFI